MPLFKTPKAKDGVALKAIRIENGDGQLIERCARCRGSGVDPKPAGKDPTCQACKGAGMVKKEGK
jgi:DnaJ-class molecular chaperone